MKRIIKGHEPQDLIDFKNENRGIKIDYNSLGEKQRTPIKKQLLLEQGYICAYTLKRINFETSHIEHIKPEELCRKETKEGLDTISDLDYTNLVACYPKEFSGSSRKKFYGAFKKDGWWCNEGENFISPLRIDCESHFKFNSDGTVNHLSVKGEETIEVLNLNHELLKEERKRAIKNFIYHKNKPINQSQTNQAIESILKINKKEYIEFCIAIRDALKDHLLKIEKIKKRNNIVAKALKKK